ncbi:MAG: type II toxin-antitoxin system VapC family toxin [Pseudomonadales bacterium]
MPGDPHGGRGDRNDALIIAEPATPYAKRPPLVADCSVLASILFDEPDRETAVEALRGRELFAPDLVDHELVSVAVKKSRQGLDEVVKQGLADLKRLQLTRCAVDVEAQWLLALEHELTAYDAAYLWLASELGAPLATFDLALGEAARRHLGRG